MVTGYRITVDGYTLEREDYIKAEELIFVGSGLNNIKNAFFKTLHDSLKNRIP